MGRGLISRYIAKALCASTLAFGIFSAQTAQSDVQSHPAMASNWASAHGGPSMQAATNLDGPTGADGVAGFAPYGDGVSGVSPWLVQTTANSLYGASLTHLFRYRTDGALRFDSGFALTRVGSISWNLFGLKSRNGRARIIVPQPLGLRNPAQRGHPCAGRIPSLLVFEDVPERPVNCTRKFEFDAVQLAALCGVPAEYTMKYSAALTGVLFSAEVAAIVSFGAGKRESSYMVVIDNSLATPLACAEIGPSNPTNMFPIERLPGVGSAAYVAIENALVRLDYDAQSRQLIKRWSVDLGMVQRTGTTPTLVGFGQDRFVVLVDGKCAVSNVFTGRIKCSTQPASRLVYVRRSETAPRVDAIALPQGIDTVENSPAANGMQIIIANYGGYRIASRARGVASLSWDRAANSWRTDWFNPAIQMNGVPTISTANGVVYGSGAASGRSIAMTGLILGGQNGGRPAYRANVGTGATYLDRGVNTVIIPGQNLVYSVDSGLVISGR